MPTPVGSAPATPATRPPAVPRTSADRGPRWLRPRTLPATVAVFAAGYLVWQPLAVGLLLPLLGQPRPASWAAWRAFLVLAAVVGAGAGALYWWSGRRPRGLTRYWGRSAARMLAVGCLLNARLVATTPAATWLLVTAGSAVAAGLLLSWLERWERLPGDDAPAV